MNPDGKLPWLESTLGDVKWSAYEDTKPVAQVHWTQGSKICSNYIILYDSPIHADREVSADDGPVYPSPEQTWEKVTVFP